MKVICKRGEEGSYVLCDDDVCVRKLVCQRREVSFVEICASSSSREGERVVFESDVGRVVVLWWCLKNSCGVVMFEESLYCGCSRGGLFWRCVMRKVQVGGMGQWERMCLYIGFSMFTMSQLERPVNTLAC